MSVITQNTTASYLPNGLQIASHTMTGEGQVQLIKLVMGAEGSEQVVSGSSRLPVEIQAAVQTVLEAIRDRLPGVLETARLAVRLPAVARTVSALRPTGAGNIAAGAVRASISNTGAASGTAAGITLRPGETLSFHIDAPDTLPAVAYDATGTEFVVMEVR